MTTPEQTAPAAASPADEPEIPFYHLSYFVTNDIPKDPETGKLKEDHPKTQELMALVGKPLRIRGYLHIKREPKKMTFFVLRQKTDTFQVAFQNKGREEWFVPDNSPFLTTFQEIIPVRILP